MRLGKGEALSEWKCLDSPWRTLALASSHLQSVGLSNLMLRMFRNTSQMRGRSVLSIVTVCLPPGRTWVVSLV